MMHVRGSPARSDAPGATLLARSRGVGVGTVEARGMSHRDHRVRRASRVAVLVLALWAPAMPVPGQTTGGDEAVVATIAVSGLALEDATVTVTALEDPLRPVTALLEMCGAVEGDRRDQEDREITEHIRRVCQAIEQLTRAMEPPTHALKPEGYLVTIPLREPIGHIRAVLWRTSSLDEAIVFLDLLGGHKLRAVTAHRKVPPSSSQAPPCAECPIKDLVFSAASLRDDPRILE